MWLINIYEGRGVQGVIVPGCPETFEFGGHSESSGDRHQRVFRVSEGDVVGSPTGVVQWTYNDGETPIVSVTLLDLSNSENQLDLSFRVRKSNTFDFVLDLTPPSIYIMPLN